MDLILWRHAEAFDSADGLDDLERMLTPKGEKQAKHMAQWLDRHLPSGVRVMASPAVRAQQTAAALERKVKTAADLAPGASVESLLHAVRWPDARDGVLVIGHQPALGLAVAYLLAGSVVPWPIRKAGVWWLRSRERAGQQQVVLHAAMAPDLL